MTRINIAGVATLLAADGRQLALIVADRCAHSYISATPWRCRATHSPREINSHSTDT
jgi:hypothetical protein